jgi:hypothetical protein
VKPYKCSKTGEQRLWFKPGEIDDWMEVELRKAKLYPTVENPQVDIETFVSGLDVDLDQYCPLPETVLGKTEFEAGKRTKVLINRALTMVAVDNADAARWLRSKWRMTMAHEASHVLLHKNLFPTNAGQRSLFDFEDDDSGSGANRHFHCLERNLARGGPDWREVQANKGMAALLMPKTLFLALCRSERERLFDAARPIFKDSAEALGLAQSLSERFDVSLQSVQIRLEELNVFATPGQIQLL